jgi:hypothetical protein
LKLPANELVKLFKLAHFTSLKKIGFAVCLLILIGTTAYKKSKPIITTSAETAMPFTPALTTEDEIITESKYTDDANCLPKKETASTSLKNIKKQSFVLSHTDSLNPDPKNIPGTPLKTSRFLKIKVIEEPDSVR